MTAISFSVFKDEILSGVKTQTIRLYKKRTYKANDRLQLYWHMRRKDCELLKEVICKEVLTVHFFCGLLVSGSDNDDDSVPLTDSEVDELVRRDGFSGYSEMYQWLYEHYPDDVMYGNDFLVIRW